MPRKRRVSDATGREIDDILNGVTHIRRGRIVDGENATKTRGRHIPDTQKETSAQSTFAKREGFPSTSDPGATGLSSRLSSNKSLPQQREITAPKISRLHAVDEKAKRRQTPASSRKNSTFPRSSPGRTFSIHQSSVFLAPSLELLEDYPATPSLESNLEEEADHGAPHDPSPEESTRPPSRITFNGASLLQNVPQPGKNSNAGEELVRPSSSGSRRGLAKHRRSPTLLDAGFGKASTGRLPEPLSTDVFANASPATYNSGHHNTVPHMRNIVLSAVDLRDAAVVGQKVESATLGQDPAVLRKVAGSVTRARISFSGQGGLTAAGRVGGFATSSEEGEENASGVSNVGGVDVTGSLDDVVEEESDNSDSEKHKVAAALTPETEGLNDLEEDAGKRETPPLVVQQLDDVENILQKYRKFWDARARVLRYEPQPAPTPERTESMQFLETRDDEQLDWFTQNVGITASVVQGIPHEDGEETSPKEADNEHAEDGHAEAGETVPDIKEAINQSGMEPEDLGFLENLSKAEISSAKEPKRQGPTVSERLTTIPNRQDPAKLLNLQPRFPTPFISDRSTLARSGSPDSLSSSGSISLLRRNIVVTSFRILQENRKRKELASQEERRSSPVTIPGISVIGMPSNSSSSGEELVSDQWPNFDKLYVPDEFLTAHRSRPLSREATREVEKLLKEEQDQPEELVDDWWLEENAYSNHSAKRVRVEQRTDEFGVLSVEPKQPPIPGLSFHPHHHHKPPEGEMGFSCDPTVKPFYKEVADADAAAGLIRNRPRWMKSTLVMDVLFTKPGSAGLQSGETIEEPSLSSSELLVAGKSLNIQPVSIGAGSASIGFDWSPAPPKLSLPLKLYMLPHSISSSPRPRSRQEEKALVDEADDQPFSYEDMISQSICRGDRITHEKVSNDRNGESIVHSNEWITADSLYASSFPVTKTNVPLLPGHSGNAKLAKILPEELDPIFDHDDDQNEEPKQVVPVEAAPAEPSQEVTGQEEEVKGLKEDLSNLESTQTPSVIHQEKRRTSQSDSRSRRASRSLTTYKSRRNSRLASIESSLSGDETGSEADALQEPAKPKLKDETVREEPVEENVEAVSDPAKTDAKNEDPVGFYIRRLRSSQNFGNSEDSELAAGTRLGSASSIYKNSSMSFSTLSLRRSVARGTSDDLSRLGDKATDANPEVSLNNAWFDHIHTVEKRELIMTYSERGKYPTLNDMVPLEASTINEGEKPDPSVEIEKLSSLISSSSLPIPAFLRARGILYCHVGKLAEAMADLTNALKHDPFNSDALWYRHQLFLKLGDPDQALKDLDGITDTNKHHLGAFLAKARIYQKLVMIDHENDVPFDTSNLGTVKLAIVNYSQIIRLKPECSDGYYQRACLFEFENEMVYANEDFKMVRQLDPSNEHAIHNLAIYSFQRQLWDDSVQAFTKLIRLNAENGQAYLFRGRALAFLAKWDDALRDLTTAVQLAPDRADVFFYRGCLLRERNKRKAIEDFSTSVLIDDSPNNVSAFNERAAVYFKLKKYELAIIDYTTVVELDPRKSSAWLRLGIIFMRFFNEYYRALECFDKAIECDPIQLRAYICRGDLYQILHSENFGGMASTGNGEKSSRKNRAGKISMVDKAIRDYSKAIHLAPSEHAMYLYRGRLLLKQGKMKEATYDFHSAFELNSSIAQTFVQRVLVLSFQRKYKQIISEFQERSKLEVITDPSLYMMIAKARIKCGDNEGAIRDLLRSLEYNKRDTATYLQLGICYENLRDWGNAVSEFTRCISICPDFAKAYYHRGICKLHEGFDKGVADLDKALKFDPKFFEAYLSRASYYHSKGAYAEGIEDCNEALRLEPSSIRAYLLRGACKCKLHQYGLAISDFTRSIQLDKGCHFAFYNRAVTYQLLEDYSNAIRDYSIVLLLQDDSNAYRNRGLIYWKQGDAENALLDLFAARDNFPGDARLHGLLALCLQKVGRTNESLEAFTSAIEVNQNFTEAYLGRGNVYASVGNITAAMRDYARVLHADPKCTEAYINMGYAMQSEGFYQKAWSLFTMAIATDPRCTSALEGRAVVHLTMKNCFGALVDISKAIEIQPDNAEYLANRAVIYQSLNDNIQALHDNKAAIKLNPEYGLAHFNAANLYFSQGRWEQALQFYTKVVDLDPNDAAAFLNRGITKAQLNRLDEAVEDMNMAAKLNPESVEVFFNRAQLCQKMGQYDAADRDYTRVIHLAPSDAMGYLKRGEARGNLQRKEEAMMDFARHVLL
ncbi:hypothetical protein DFJ73DRAFT_64411 [Zopfochytrium polystomum]|nr:hypothetical protein DFJ73DRAFT_64411 [Zopfochytrium polystomum]